MDRVEVWGSIFVELDATVGPYDPDAVTDYLSIGGVALHLQRQGEDACGSPLYEDEMRARAAFWQRVADEATRLADRDRERADAARDEVAP